MASALFVGAAQSSILLSSLVGFIADRVVGLVCRKNVSLCRKPGSLQVKSNRAMLSPDDRYLQSALVSTVGRGHRCKLRSRHFVTMCCNGRFGETGRVALQGKSRDLLEDEYVRSIYLGAQGKD
jgi:hypothetical protein